ncbi:MAG: alpha/beta hydrolase [Muribaculaceae bacterium]|nr:alpha/beta hydrolase [Muribaculaceae bacterium]
MMKSYRLILPLFIIAGTFYSVGKLTHQPVFTPAQQTAMLNEADDFIDALPEGLQDIQADAVLRAIRGDGAQLAKIRESRNASPNLSEKVNHTSYKENGIEMQLYSPKKIEGELPLLVYFHGGGWTFGSINSCAHFCDSLAETGKAGVLAVDYSLAPEHKFPSGLDDCLTSIEFALKNLSEWGFSSISLGGDSSGANLALASQISLIEKGKGEDIESLILIYPVLKAFPDKSESWRKYARGYGLNRRLMESFFEAYLSSTDSEDALASPGLAIDSVLKKMPPLLLINAERDILFDQGKEFALKIKEIGNHVDWVTMPGATHLFITVPGQPTAFSTAVSLCEDFLSGK